MDVVEELEKLKLLLNDGTITDEEYKILQNAIINNLKNTNTPPQAPMQNMQAPPNGVNKTIIIVTVIIAVAAVAIVLLVLNKDVFNRSDGKNSTETTTAANDGNENNTDKFFESNPDENANAGEPDTDIIDSQTNTESSGIVEEIINEFNINDENDLKFIRSLPPSAFIYDESEWPLEENYVPLFPEFTDSISWWSHRKGFAYGYGTIVNAKDDVKGYVNIRNYPSLSATVVGELYPGYSPGDTASMVPERYQTRLELFTGTYNVWSDGYFWYYIELDYPSALRGWVAADFVELSGV